MPQSERVLLDGFINNVKAVFPTGYVPRLYISDNEAAEKQSAAEVSAGKECHKSWLQ
jgi:hypothetical protein